MASHDGLTLTLEGACQIFRSYGIPMDKGFLANGIESGVFPVGTVMKVSGTGRRTFLIWKKDLLDFLESKRA